MAAIMVSAAPISAIASLKTKLKRQPNPARSNALPIPGDT